MAEVTAMRNNALPYPVYGLPYVIVYPFLDADGDLVTGATTPDAEISKNGDTFADCTNESTEIATSSGIYYLSLTGTELTCDVATIIAKSATSGMKTTVATLYPRKLVSIRAGTSASGGVSTSTIVLDASASAVDDFYNGMIVAAVIDSTTEVRMITDYTGSTQTATVTPDWNTAPDNNDTFTVYLPDGVQINQANVTQWLGANAATPTTAGVPEVDITHIAGAAVSTTTAQLGVNVVQLSADATAADNAEAFFDGTGYAGTNNVIPTVTTVTNLTNAPTSGDLTATMKSSVNAEIVDALSTDTYAEPGQGAPAATTTLAAKINYLYKAFRNKTTQTSTTWSLFADDATTVDQKSTVSDDGTTFTRGEIAAGP
jgi:hypothetical protein